MKTKLPHTIDSGHGEVIIFKEIIHEPDGDKIIFEDKIKGKIEFDTSLLGDFVIAKNLEYPLYNFVVVIDDELMQITHIIRGDDHIANTPKQILISNRTNDDRKRQCRYRYFDRLDWNRNS